MTDDLSVFELQDSGDSPLATALVEAAAWQARAARLEGALKGMEGAFRDAVDTAVDAIRNGTPGRDAAKSLADHVRGRCETANEALSSPRPEPSRLLEVVRAGLSWEEECKARPHCRELYLKALDQLRNAIAALTPEERAAILRESE